MIYVTLVRTDRVGFSAIAAVSWKDEQDIEPLSVGYDGVQRKRSKRETASEYVAYQASHGKSVRMVPAWCVDRLLQANGGLLGDDARRLVAELAIPQPVDAAKSAARSGAAPKPVEFQAEVDSTRMTPAEFEQHMKRKFQKAWDTW